MNKEVRPFEEYKEMIQDMSKDNMIKGLYDLSANIIEQNKEIERLNNIIDELEKFINSYYAKNGDYDAIDTIATEILNKLKELKGE